MAGTIKLNALFTRTYSDICCSTPLGEKLFKKKSIILGLITLTIYLLSCYFIEKEMIYNLNGALTISITMPDSFISGLRSTFKEPVIN